MTQLPSLEQWALLPFWGFPTLTRFLFFWTCYFLGTSSFILLFYLYWYSYIVYFVCDSASEFGAMGSTSFMRFSYPNLLLVFLDLLFFRNLFIYFIFLPVLVFLYSIVCLWLSFRVWSDGLYFLFEVFLKYILIIVNLFNFFMGEGIASSSFFFFPPVLVFLYNSIFCLWFSFRVWSNGLYFLFGVFLP